MFKILFAIFALAIASTNAFWGACNDGGPTPTSLTSSFCTGTTCTVTRGQVLTASFVFPANVAASSLAVSISAFAQAAPTTRIPIAVTPPHNDACNAISPSCPTVVGTSYTWTINFEVPTDIPAINGWFEFQLNSGTTTGAIVSCARATASLH